MMEEELTNYEGQVLNGKLHGKGKLWNEKGSVEGTFKEGTLEGEAIVSMANGNKYQIVVKDGKLMEKKVLQKVNKPTPAKPSHPYSVGKGVINPPPKHSFFFFPDLE
ncbi:MAG: hypothetical protein RLZZ44_1316 [Bacteroidota bacterium]|jgi:hypothetical protein